MSESQFESEIRAQKSLLALMESARETARLFRVAGLDVPPVVARIFGETAGPKTKGHSHLSIPALQPPENSVAGLQRDWIWVETNELLVSTLAFAILRTEGGGPIPTTELYRLATAYQPQVNQTSLLNAGPRFDGKLISRSEEGWTLIDPAKVPQIDGSHAWGPADSFQMHEKASFRRTVILHILEASPGGLMTMQVLEKIKHFEFYKFPISKDLIQDDLEKLQASDKTRRISNSRKWTLAKKVNSSDEQ